MTSLRKYAGTMCFVVSGMACGMETESPPPPREPVWE